MLVCLPTKLETFERPGGHQLNHSQRKKGHPHFEYFGPPRLYRLYRSAHSPVSTLPWILEDTMDLKIRTESAFIQFVF